MYLSRKGVLPDDVDMFGMGVSLDDDGEHDDLFASGAVEDEPQATEDDGDDLFGDDDGDDLFADDDDSDDLFADDGDSDDLFAEDEPEVEAAADEVPEAPSEPVEEYVEEEPAGDDEDDDDDIDALFA